MEKDRFKSTRVKRTMLLAISPVKENYESVRLLLRKLDLDDVEIEDFFSQDLKCINLVCGLGNHHSSYPCALCLWKNGD